MTTVQLPLLSQVRVASPCSARWEDMTGDERTRHCGQCNLDVHNLSAMTADEAESFLRAKVGTGRVCARIFRREDGTILTRDCPVGLALWRKRAGWAAGRVAAAGLFLVTGGWALGVKDREAFAARLRAAQPFRSVCEWFNPQAPAPPVTRVLTPMMGDICIPPPKAVPVKANGVPYIPTTPGPGAAP